MIRWPLSNQIILFLVVLSHQLSLFFFFGTLLSLLRLIIFSFLLFFLSSSSPRNVCAVSPAANERLLPDSHACLTWVSQCYIREHFQSANACRALFQRGPGISVDLLFLDGRRVRYLRDRRRARGWGGGVGCCRGTSVTPQPCPKIKSNPLHCTVLLVSPSLNVFFTPGPPDEGCVCPLPTVFLHSLLRGNNGRGQWGNVSE